MNTISRRALIGAAAATAAVGATPATAAAAPAAGTAAPGLPAAPGVPMTMAALEESLGFYLSTMNPANTGAANATAFEADIAAANGRQILVPPGDTPYTVGAVEITGATINVRFLPGARLVPDAGLHAVGGRMFHATNCNTRLYGLVVDGQNIPETCWRSDGGEFRAYDTTLSNMGFLDLPGTAASLGTLGILCKGVAEVLIDGYTGRDFVGRKDGTFANNAGKVNHLMVYECERVAIRNVTISGGEGEDNDFFHILDLRATENESEIRNCVVKGFSRSVVVQGNRTRVVGNVLDDPQDLWFQGGSSSARDFLELSGNKVYTRTAGAMATSRCSRIDNYTNLECHDNTLIQAGNTTHATVFIDITNPNAVGFATNNRAPAGTTAVRTGASSVALFQNQGLLLRPLLTTTTVGTITTGEDNLQTHLVPAYNLARAGAAMRTTFTGTVANNANAKTLRVYVGTSLVMTKALTAGQVGAWEVQIVLISLGPDSQKYTVRFLECDTAGSAAPTQAGLAVGTLAEVTSASIILKTTGEGVATNDVIGQTAVSESLEGRHFVIT